jgi:hypothetical protein
VNSVSKGKEWINEHIPMLAIVYENKYVGMLYDRFGSLPPKQQRQVLLGAFIGVILFICLILLSLYLTVWSYSNQTEKARSMVALLTQYQKNRRLQEGQIQLLEQNNLLSAPDALKAYLMDQAKAANISSRMIHAEEKPDSSEGSDDPKGKSDLKLKQATVKLEKVNLTQLRNFLQYVEFGQYSLSISSLKILNDDKIRGYMNVEMGIVAYLFQSEESE